MARRGRPRKQRPVPKKYFFLFFSVSIFILVLFTSISVPLHRPRWIFFKITNVDTSDEISDRLKRKIVQEVKNASLLSFDIQAFREKLIKTNPKIKQIKITKNFPCTLKIDIEERVPFFQLKNDAYFIVGKDFKVMAKQEAPQEKLVVVETEDDRQSIKKGGYLEDERLNRAGSLIDTLTKFDKFSPDVIMAHSLDSISFMTSDTKVILGDGDFERKLKILNSLMEEKFNNDFSRLLYVDLRYNKVYIGKKK